MYAIAANHSKSKPIDKASSAGRFFGGSSGRAGALLGGGSLFPGDEELAESPRFCALPDGFFFDPINRAA
jgi:hypothetical protein